MSTINENEKKVTEKEEGITLNVLVFDKLTKLAAEETRIKAIYQFLVNSISNCKQCLSNKEKGCQYHRAFTVDFNQRVVDLVMSAKESLNQIASMYSDLCQTLLINETNPLAHIGAFPQKGTSVTPTEEDDEIEDD